MNAGSGSERWMPEARRCAMREGDDVRWSRGKRRRDGEKKLQMQ